MTTDSTARSDSALGGCDPFFITGPALISFSGGRTSAMMLQRIVETHGGKLPDDVYVAFANTGKEREETLRFVHECATRWGVRVRWLEFVTDLKSVGAAGRFEEVGYNSASRDGEPLNRLIARKNSLFSTLRGRWCTEFCKVGVQHDFMESQGYPRGSYAEIIGFRADEYDRVVEMPQKPRAAGRDLRFPLAEAGIRKGDVNDHWTAQPFDLELERGTGNCDHCPFLNEKARVIRARRDPLGCRWWDGHEKARGFSFGYTSFADILAMAKASPLLPLDDIEAEAADEIAALRARVAELEAENDRLTKAVGSGILGELLNDEETDEFVNFIKFLRGQTKEAGCGKV